MMNLFEGEQIITTTDSNIVVLTTHRIRSNNSVSWGQHRTTSIMLEKVSAIQATYISFPILLVLSGAMALGAAWVSGQSGVGGGIALLVILAIVCLIGYFATRKHVCVIVSDGGSRIVFETANMKKDVLNSFIDQVERAKYKRVSQVIF
jgi:hypothetical protein